MHRMHHVLPALNHLTLRAVATGTAVDDALGLPELVSVVLAAIDDDDYEAVCKTAGSWCRAFEASGISCRDAHDTWRALAARVFPGARTLDKENAQANFYALCQRANEYRNGARYLRGSGDEDVRVFVMAAVKHNGNALQHAHASLKKDPKIVMAAVTQSGVSLSFADASLKKNYRIVLAAVTKKGDALLFADDSLKGNPAIVLAAVTQEGRVLYYADAALKNDPKIVLAAVTQNGYHGLAWASLPLQNNREIVLVAVTQRGLGLKYASSSLQNDREIVLAAVTQNGNALKYASLSLQKDREIVQAAVTQNPRALDSILTDL